MIRYRLRPLRTTERRRFLFGVLVNFASQAGSDVSDFLGPTLTSGLEGAALGAGVGALGSKLAGGSAGTGALIGGGIGGAGGLAAGALSGSSGAGASGSPAGSAAPPSVPITDPTGGFGSTATPGANLITGMDGGGVSNGVTAPNPAAAGGGNGTMPV